MDCLLDQVLAALAGAEPADVRMVTAPPALSGRPHARAVGKAVYGEDLAHHLDGPNITVQWDDPTVDPDRAAALLEQVELGWRVLVEEGGWPAPRASDAYLVWVILDPGLPGSGYTTVYADDTYPEGYPVIYLNPAYAADIPAFGLSVAVHEFGHALQFGLRGADRGLADAWYWEATSEWVAETVSPDLDTYAQSAAWYARWPDARYDTVPEHHGYGMVLLNAWLDERVFGFAGVRDVWLAAGDRPWGEVIADVAEQDLGELVAEMSAEVAAGTLRESALYEAPVRAYVGPAPGWETRALPGLYGSFFFDLEDGAGVAVEGPVATRWVADGQVSDTTSAGPGTLVITALVEGGTFAWGSHVPQPAADPEGCGCVGRGAGGPASLPVSVLVLLVGARRRLRRAGGAS